jgi:hypothetical protein
MSGRIEGVQRLGKGAIEVCARCLHVHREGAEVELFKPWFPYRWGLACLCTDKEQCEERRKACKAEHEREVAHRVKHLKPGERLLVIRDKFGDRYDSYGNFYVKVEAGVDPQDVWEQKQAEAKEKGEEGVLVLCAVLVGDNK